MAFITYQHYRIDYDLKESNGKWFVSNLRIASPDKKEVVAYGPKRSDFDKGFSSPRRGQERGPGFRLE